jgi:hypothetical protein
VGSDGLPAAIRNLETASLRGLEVLSRREEVVFGGLESPGESAS